MLEQTQSDYRSAIGNRWVDVEQTILAFGATVRDQVDIEALSEALLATVESSIQPKRLSLWLRRYDPSR